MQQLPRTIAEVKELLGKMTVDEKIAQLGSFWLYDLQSKGTLDPARIASKLKDGIGQVTRIGGAGSYLPLEAAKTANIIQKYLKNRPVWASRPLCTRNAARG